MGPYRMSSRTIRTKFDVHWKPNQLWGLISVIVVTGPPKVYRGCLFPI